MGHKRDRSMVVKSQFSINGSRGKSPASFILDYVTRQDAVESSTAYGGIKKEAGDGVALTLHASSVPRSTVEAIAQEVESFHDIGKRAIQEMVVSFEHDYLVEKGLIDGDLIIQNKGDYRGHYDDVRLRHALMSGFQAMVDHENYRKPHMVAAIQDDTLHLHAHAVVYERAENPGRMRGIEEKGVLKESSFATLTHEIDRSLDRSRGVLVTSSKLLNRKREEKKSRDLDIGLIDESSILDHLAFYQELLENVKEEELSLEEVEDEIVEEDLEAVEDIGEDKVSDREEYSSQVLDMLRQYQAQVYEELTSDEEELNEENLGDWFEL